MLDRLMFQKILLVTLVVCPWLPAQIITTRCNESELADSAKPAVALAYLSQDRATLSSACLIKAIRNIREYDYKPAIPVLTKYLDFRMPPPFAPFDPLTRQPTGGLYPAADVLARFGEAAVPALKAAVNNDDLNKIERINGAEALFSAGANKPQAIRSTAKAAQSSQDSDVAGALRKLANDMARNCRPEETKQCQDAANDQ